MKRIDERDTMFARMGYTEGTPQYEDYYNRNPHKKAVDDRLREMPNLCSPGTGTYDEVTAPFVDSGFKVLAGMRHLASGEKSQKKVEISPESMTERIKGLLTYLGARDVRVTPMKEEYYYTNRGRHRGNYGERVEEDLPFAIVYSVEMDEDMINRAPNLEEVIAVTKGYMDAAVIGIWGGEYIRSLGYDARAHVDGNYLVYAPLIGQAAGLGMVGRHGLLVSENEGSRIRLGVITTDLPLNPDERIDFGLKELCHQCRNCEKNCPGKAIGDEGLIQERCYEVWRRVGTDCGVCLSSCPLSQEVGRRYRGKLKSKDERERLLEEHRENYGRRNYIHDSLKIIR